MNESIFLFIKPGQGEIINPLSLKGGDLNTIAEAARNKFIEKVCIGLMCPLFSGNQRSYSNVVCDGPGQFSVKDMGKKKPSVSVVSKVNFPIAAENKAIEKQVKRDARCLNKEKN